MTEPTRTDEEHLLDLLTGFLDPAEVSALEARLAQEEPLQALYQRLRQEQAVLNAALAQDVFEAPPADLSERVLAGFAASEAAPGPTVLVGRSEQASPATGRRWALLAAALFVVGGLLALRVQPDPDHPRAVMNRQVRTSELLALGLLPKAPQ